MTCRIPVRPDGTPVTLPTIRVSFFVEPYRFLPNGRGLIYTQGLWTSQIVFDRLRQNSDIVLIDLRK